MVREQLASGTFGDISVKKHTDRAQWKARARYRDTLGGYHGASALGPTKTAARDALVEKLERLTQASVTASVTTVSELCWSWYDQVEAESEAFWSRPDAAYRQGVTPPRPQSLVHTKRAINYVCAKDGGIGDLRLDEVTTLALESWLEGHKLISRSRAAEIRIALRGVFRSAVRLGILPTDPMAGVSAVRRHDPRPVALEADELRLIRRILRDEPTLKITRATARNLDALLVLLLGAALRVGEAVALRWRDVVLDGDEPSVTISGTQVEITGKGAFRQEAPKTDSSNRTVLLAPAVVEMLKQIRPEGWKPLGWVFPTRNGTAWNSGNADKVLDQIIAKSNGALESHRVTFHKLRSTAATAIAEAHSDHVAAQVLGHKPQGVTQSHYIARRTVAPDVRETLQALVESSEPTPQVERRIAESPEALARRTIRRHLRVV